MQAGLCVLLLGVFLWAIFFLNRKYKVQQAVPFFALMTSAFIVIDIYSFMSGYQPYKPAYGQKYTWEAASPDLEETIKKHPNIYHIILDEYQTDMFSMTLDPEIRKKLGGFVFSPEAVTVFGRTEMSFATIFSGKNYDFKSPPLGYQKAAFNTEDSFLFWLKKAGYRTSAVMHPVFNFKLKGFDSVAFHKEVRQLNYAAVNLVFRKLSFYSNFPALVAEKM